MTGAVCRGLDLGHVDYGNARRSPLTRRWLPSWSKPCKTGMFDLTSDRASDNAPAQSARAGRACLRSTLSGLVRPRSWRLRTGTDRRR